VSNWTAPADSVSNLTSPSPSPRCWFFKASRAPNPASIPAPMTRFISALFQSMPLPSASDTSASPPASVNPPIAISDRNSLRGDLPIPASHFALMRLPAPSSNIAAAMSSIASSIGLLADRNACVIMPPAGPIIIPPLMYIGVYTSSDVTASAA
jgi:hypothetical protein